jgi:hypothetical protein
MVLQFFEVWFPDVNYNIQAVFEPAGNEGLNVFLFPGNAGI